MATRTGKPVNWFTVAVGLLTFIVGIYFQGFIDGRADEDIRRSIRELDEKQQGSFRRRYDRMDKKIDKVIVIVEAHRAEHYEELKRRQEGSGE